MLKEFREFIQRGNVLDLAVAVIIGAAFNTIVKSLVDDVIMPVMGLFTGGLDFTNWFVSLDGSTYQTLAEAQEAGAATLNYGLFLNAVLNFLIVSFAIFFIIKQVNRFKKKEAAKQEAPPTPPKEEQLLTEIRDLLKEQVTDKG